MLNEEFLRQQALVNLGCAEYARLLTLKLPDSPDRRRILEIIIEKGGRALQVAYFAGASKEQIDTHLRSARESAKLKVPPTIPQMENMLGVKTPRKIRDLPQS